jgi:hypothetical protein
MPTKIPLRPSRMKIRRKTIKWIVVHDTAEFSEQPQTEIDNTIYQYRYLYNDVLEKKVGDVNYHYVIERINEDYVPIVTRPISFLCDWPDIPDEINKRAIHVAALGNYNFKVPEKRLYEIMAFKVINPIIKLASITPQKVKLHREISSNKDLQCPGDFFQKNVLIAMLRKYVVM